MAENVTIKAILNPTSFFPFKIFCELMTLLPIVIFRSIICTKTSLSMGNTGPEWVNRQAATIESNNGWIQRHRAVGQTHDSTLLKRDFFCLFHQFEVS